MLTEFGHGNALMPPPLLDRLARRRAAIYKHRNDRRDLLSMFGGKDTTEAVAAWIEDHSKWSAERESRSPRPGRSRRKKIREADARSRNPPATEVRGVRARPTRRDIARAYASLDLSPRQIRRRPPGNANQDQAHRRMTEINAAYEAMKRAGRVK